MKNIEIWNEKSKIPIIASIPHSGTHIPNSMKIDLIDNVKLANMDWYLPKLYSFLRELNVTTIINNVSRYVIDPNREITDSTYGSYIKNYIYLENTFGEKMYKNIPNKNEINNRIEQYYYPYHETIKKSIVDKLKIVKKVYLLDLHSFGKVNEYEIILGNRDGVSCSNQFTSFIKDELENQRFNVGINIPYRGGFITKKYVDQNVETMQIELSYKKYIDDRNFENEEFPIINMEHFNKTQENLRLVFKELINNIY